MRTGALRRGRARGASSNKRGFLNRILGRVTKAVTKPWHMYPIGLLFGLGFDTATEVGLLVLAGGAAAFSLPWYAILTLPILFAAGMCLLDTIDGVLHELRLRLGVLQAGPQDLLQHHRSPALSVAVALIIGTIELVSILAEKLGHHHAARSPAIAGARPRLRRLRHRRPVRRHLGRRARRLAVRPDRGALVPESEGLQTTEAFLA